LLCYCLDVIISVFVSAYETINTRATTSHIHAVVFCITFRIILYLFNKIILDLLIDNTI